MTNLIYYSSYRLCFFNIMSNWPEKAPNWASSDENNLLVPQVFKQYVSLEEVIDLSDSFPIEFPINSIKCRNLQEQFSQKQLENNINSTYPLIHEYALKLCAVFLAHQKRFGNHEFYKDMTLIDLIDRLLSKRAVSFLGIMDRYLLIDKSHGYGDWEKIGTYNEKPPLVLQNCLSYDEIKLSALLSVSSHTVFINDGNRYNKGVFENDRTKVEEDGVIIGLIGTRLEKDCVMEYREIIKDSKQNTHQFGYGIFFLPTLHGQFLNFYGDVSVTFQQLLPELQRNTERYVKILDDIYFDKLMYGRRIALSIDTLLIEGNHRAKVLGKQAYIHVVGLGLGVWKIWDGQNQVFMNTFAERLEYLSPYLQNISDVCFAYIHCSQAGKYKHKDKIQHIQVLIEDRDPHLKLTGEHEGKLLVVSYAWDGNAHPGNEFWLKSLCGSGDPAAAASTQVAELHNWHINKKVSGCNLKVATLNNGLMTFEDYCKLHKND